MVKVPRYDQSTSITTARGPRLEANAPPGAAGAGLGQAVAGLGAVIQEHADQMQKRVDQTAADEAFIEYTTQRNKLLYMDENAFYNLNGKQAVDAYDPTVEQLKKLRENYGSALSPNSRAIFNNATDQDIAYSINNMSSHTAKGLRDWEKQTAESYLASRSDQMATATEEQYDEMSDSALDYMFANQTKLGLDDPYSFEQYARNWMSLARAKRIGLMMDADPVGALNYAKQHRDEFTPDVYSKIISNLHGRADPIIAQEAAERAVASISGTAAPNFDNEVDRLIDEREGEALVQDNNGAATKFGINKKANPDIDVANLTRDEAKRVYKERYWDPLGADDLPPALASSAFDAAVNQGLGRAKRWLEESGGDLDKFNELRREAYRAHPEYAKYGKVWERRIVESSVSSPPKKAIDVRANIPVVHAAIDADDTLTEAQKRMARTASNAIVTNQVIETQARQSNYMEVAYGIAIGAPEGADAPTSLAQAMENKDFARAYLALDVKSQDFIQTQIQQNSRKQNPPMTAEFLALQSQYDVAAAINPDSFPSHEQILAAAETAAEAGNPWPNSLLKHVLSLRTKLIKGDVDELNKSTQAAMGLKPINLILNDLNIMDGNRIKDEEKYNKFFGQMDAHIKAYQAVYKKNPDEAELIRFAGNLVTDKKLFGIFTVGEAYNEALKNSIIKRVPDTEIPTIVQDLKQMGITRPTPEQIYQMWQLGQEEQ